MPLSNEHSVILFLYIEACEKARQESIKDQCTRHVNPVVSVFSFDEGYVPAVSGFAVSDWHEPNTLTSFTCGREH